MMLCPLCYTELEVRNFTSCDNCGWDNKELTHLKENKHIYTTYEIYNGLRLTFCNFCNVDFSSYRPEYFGFKNKQKIGLQHFHFIREIENPQTVKDKFCPTCSARLSFLNFLVAIRQHNE